MPLEDIYRRVRYRSKDPLRQLHVPRRKRLDTDEDGGTADPDARDFDPSAEPLGDVVPEEDLR